MKNSRRGSHTTLRPDFCCGGRCRSGGGDVDGTGQWKTQPKGDCWQDARSGRESQEYFWQGRPGDRYVTVAESRLLRASLQPKVGRGRLGMFNVMERQAGLPKGPAQHSKRFDVRWRAMWRSSRTVFLRSGCTLGPAGLNTTSLRFIIVVAGGLQHPH